MKKKLTGLFFVLALILITSMVALVVNNRQHDVYTGETSDFVLTPREQQALLRELMMIIDSGCEIMARDINLPVDMPRINGIMPPYSFYGRGYLIIGVDLDYGDLTYEDQDTISELAAQPVPDEVVDFILSFANIPKEHAVIAYAVSMDTPLLPCDFELSGIFTAWGDDLSAGRFY